MLNLDPAILSLAVATGIGLMIGAERERRKEERPAPASAGLRTFALASLSGALCVIICGQLLLALTVGGVFAPTGFAYWRGYEEDPSLATEIGLVVTVLLGGLAMTRPGLASGVAAILIVVILVMAIGAFGHIAVRFLGPRFGVPIAGLASGFASSSATIAAIGARAAKTSDLFIACGGGRYSVNGRDRRPDGVASRCNQSGNLAGARHTARLRERSRRRL